MKYMLWDHIGLCKGRPKEFQGKVLEGRKRYDNTIHGWSRHVMSIKQFFSFFPHSNFLAHFFASLGLQPFSSSFLFICFQIPCFFLFFHFFSLPFLAYLHHLFTFAQHSTSLFFFLFHMSFNRMMVCASLTREKSYLINDHISNKITH